MTQMHASWPTFVQCWPEAPLNVAGLSGRVLEGPNGSTMFLAAYEEVTVPAHRHGAQWGIVLAGSMELTMNGTSETLRPGQAHYIPEGVEHEAVLHAGWQALYVFDRKKRPVKSADDQGRLWPRR